jgi:hypothetical protein
MEIQLMNKQEVSAQAVVDVEMTAIDALSADLAAVVAPQNELNQAFEDDKKLDEELELSQAKGEAVQVASADNGAAAMLLTDTNQAATGAALGGGAAASTAISTNAFLIAGAATAAAVAFVATDDDDNNSSGTTPDTPDTPNTAPVVSADQNLSVAQGKSTVITVVATDADGDQLVFAPSNPANGTLGTTDQPGQYTYISDAGFVGTDTFTVTVSDEDSNTVTRTITIDVTKAQLPEAERTFELTTAADTYLGGTEDNIINAKYPEGSTLTSFDDIDGGDGADTFNIYTDGVKNNSSLPSTAEIKNVETVNIFNDSDSAVSTTLTDASEYAGIEALNQIGTRAQNVTDLLATTTAGFTGTTSNFAVAAEVAATSATVNLTNVDASTADLTVTGDALSSLTVTGTTTGAADLIINVTVGENVESLTVNTAVDSVVNVAENLVAPDNKPLTTFDASGSTGDVDYTAATTSVATATTGTGDDEVRLVTATSDTVGAIINASVDTGAGDDEVTVITSGTGDTTVNAGDGDDEVNVANGNVGDTVDTTVNAGDGDDEVNVDSIGAGNTTVNLGSGSNELVVGAGYNDTGLLTITGGSGVDTIETDGAANLTINSGAGNDVISGVALAATVFIDGGAGIDTLAIDNDATLSVVDLAVLTNNVSDIETLQFQNAITFDSSDLNGLTTLAFDDDSTVTEVAATQVIIASADIDATAADYVDAADLGAGVLNITANGSGDVRAQAKSVNLTVIAPVPALVTDDDDVTADLAGTFESANVTLVSNRFETAPGADNDAALDYTSSAGAKTLVISGEGSAVVDNTGGFLTSVDASGLSNTNFNDTAGVGLTYIAGANADTITSSAGNDILVFNNLAGVVVPAGSTVDSLDTVFGFDSTREAANPSTDVIRFGDDGAGANLSLLINGLGGGNLATAVDVTAATTLAFAFDTASQVGSALQTFQFEGDTYLFQNDTANTTLDGSDYALRVDGLVDFTTTFTA